MFELVAMHVMILAVIITSLIGAICILRGMKIFNLGISTRNMMYIGACCSMCFGFIGAAFCMGSLVLTQWHYVAAAVMAVLGVFATIHIAVDLNNRLIIQ